VQELREGQEGRSPDPDLVKLKMTADRDGNHTPDQGHSLNLDNSGPSNKISDDFVTNMSETQQIEQWMNPGLLNVISEDTPGFDFPHCLRDRYSEDQFFDNIIKAPKEFRNFVIEDGLIYLQEDYHKVLCIPKILIEGRRAQEIVITHAHSILAHLGSFKTMTYLRDHVWWANMSRDVKNYCASCVTCWQSKPSNQKPYGLLNPLQVPTRPWEAIRIDFIGPLPVSRSEWHGYG
jgi:hypothetical protein